MAFLGDDEWAYRPRRPPARHQHSNGYPMNLDPNAYRRQDPNGLHRTRSTGHSPAPIVNVYNDVYSNTDAHLRNDSHSPPMAPMPPYPAAPPVAYPTAMPGAFPAAMPNAYPVPIPVPVPEYRDRGRDDRLGADLADELHEMRLERRMRSRSRGRSDASSYTSEGRGRSSGRSEYYKHELDRLERERREDEQREAWKREEARIKSEMEIKRLKDEAKRAADDQKHDADRKRVIEDYERKQREAKEKAKADEIRFMEKREREKREAKEEEQRFLEKMEREKREAKEEERRVIEKVEREKREAKEREDREWAEFERRRKEKEEKEAKEKKEAQAKLDEAMRKRLAETGFTQSQIDAIMDKEKKKQEPTSKTTTTTTTTLARVPLRGHVPVYAKIHVDYISTETLRYYDIPWEYDRVSFVRFPAASRNPTNKHFRTIHHTSSSYAKWTSMKPTSSSTTLSGCAKVVCCSMRLPKRSALNMLFIASAARVGLGTVASGRSLGSWSIRSERGLVLLCSNLAWRPIHLRFECLMWMQVDFYTICHMRTFLRSDYDYLCISGLRPACQLSARYLGMYVSQFPLTRSPETPWLCTKLADSPRDSPRVACYSPQEQLTTGSIVRYEASYEAHDLSRRNYASFVSTMRNKCFRHVP
jgi:hypothetical protein